MVVTSYLDKGFFSNEAPEVEESQSYAWTEKSAGAAGEDTIVLEVGPAQVTVHPGTEFLVEDVDTPGRYRIFLKKGAISSKVRKLADGEAYELRTPNSVAGVRGTEFTVRYGDRYYRKTDVYVVEGMVVLVNEMGDSITIGPLQHARIIETHPPTYIKDEGDDGRGDIEIAALGFAAPAGADFDGADQVTICHMPPGDPAGAVTIMIARSALETHLSHGDRIGPCKATVEAPKNLYDIIMLPDIKAAYQERYGEAHKQELMKSYRKLEGQSAAEISARNDLDDLELMVFGKMKSAYGSGFGDDKIGGATLEEDYKRYDRQDTASLKELYKKDYSGTGFGDPDLLKKLGQ